MYPAQCDEIVLVLYEEEFLFVFCVAIVWPTALFRYDDMSNCERISGLENTTKFNVRDCILTMCPTASPRPSWLNWIERLTSITQMMPLCCSTLTNVWPWRIYWKMNKEFLSLTKSGYGSQTFKTSILCLLQRNNESIYHHLIYTNVCASCYRSIQREFNNTALFRSLTSLPQRMPQVSTIRLVLASANLRKLWHSSAGTASCRRASTIVSARTM